MLPKHILLSFMSIFCLASEASVTPEYDWHSKLSGNQLVIHVRNGSAIPVTLQIVCHAVNAPTTVASYIVEASPHAKASKSFPLPSGQALPDKSHCSFSGAAGFASATGRTTYRLPFAVKRGICVGQAPGSLLTTHQSDPSSLQAIDFLLDEGERVVAARDGIVFKAIDQFDRGGPSLRFRDKANFIEIVHADGTMTEYAHLMKGSSRVKEGQFVQAGETIASAGMSGQAAGPHLHFAIGHPLLATSPNGQSILQGMVSVPGNFEIGGRAIQVHLGGFIQDSDSTPSYQPASSHCLNHSPR